ncbi:MAG: DegT/DnrJ/EryC1/StrS family aminotransferase [Elusimicrobia bacterium]|nr:DegT/DnrJ/EryC1/StrS family aminotransferase [Elusimicrobiota bacterium]
MDAAIAGVIGSSAFIRGPYVDAFEKEFAALIGAPHCVSCGNGTDSLYIAMRALGVKPGDEVIIPAHSWIATSETVTQAGGTVVFCDTDEDTFTLDPALIEARITPRTVGIIPVHLYGQAAEMGRIMDISRRHRLWVLEDCAQAHLATCNGRTVGTFGAAGSFSFYPGKNLGAMGDAGALVTADGALAERMAMLARHGGLVKNEHRIEGVNSRMDGLQAAVLSVKMKQLKAWTAMRRRLAGVYDRELSGIEGLDIPITAGGREHVYHLYVVRHARRDELKKFLAERGIETVINYPAALPFLPAYARLGARPEDFPNAYRHQSSVLSLPLFPEMTEAQQAAVIEAVRAFSFAHTGR